MKCWNYSPLKEALGKLTTQHMVGNVWQQLWWNLSWLMPPSEKINLAKEVLEVQLTEAKYSCCHLSSKREVSLILTLHLHIQIFPLMPEGNVHYVSTFFSCSLWMTVLCVAHSILEAKAYKCMCFIKCLMSISSYNVYYYNQKSFFYKIIFRR